MRDCGPRRKAVVAEFVAKWESLCCCINHGTQEMGRVSMHMTGEWRMETGHLCVRTFYLAVKKYEVFRKMYKPEKHYFTAVNQTQRQASRVLSHAQILDCKTKFID